MKKGQVLEGIIERVDFPNKGIVMTEEGKQVTVKNGISGQKIRFAINKLRKGKSEGRLLEVLERSPLELHKFPCRHFEICGGCTYQSLPYEEQLKLKSGQVKRLLDAVIPDAAPYTFEEIKPSPRQFSYRNKMEFTFGDEYKDGPLALGMHKRGSFYDIVPVADCQIVDEDYRKILHCVQQYFQEKRIPFYHRLRHTGYLRHLLVRKAVKTGEILIDLVTASSNALRLDVCNAESDKADVQIAAGSQIQSEELEKELLLGMTENLQKLTLEGTIAGILHTRNDGVADTIKNEGTDILCGRDYFYEELLGLKFRISPFSFFQTNSLGAEVLYQTVRDFIGDTLAEPEDKEQGSIVFDLYSGTGTIAQMLSPVAKKVVGVEIVEEAVEAAKENAKLNKLGNCEFIAGDVLKVLDTIEEKPDFIVLDPPRDGIHPKALEKIIQYGVERMVYVSCKPTSLARDLEMLQERGYRVERVCCVDMFPGTANVETVCLLSKLHSDQHIEVELQMDELDLTAAESKATYEEIKDYVLEHTGLKVSSLYIAQVKEKCGIIERVNYNLPKSENSRQPKCPPEKEAAIREALEYFRMI